MKTFKLKLSNELIVFLLAITFAVMCFFLGFFSGQNAKHREISDRALKQELKPCYDWQDLETIVFGEKQE